MVAIYRLDQTAVQVAGQFGLSAGDDPWAGGVVSPGQFAPVITAGREQIAGPRRSGSPLRLVPRQWGVPPPRSAVEQARRGVLTVRNPDSPFWIGNLRNSEFRCLIPASAFMVWSKRLDREGKRHPLWTSVTDQPLFAMAGVWMDSEVPSFAVMTCAANAALRAEGHETMPVVLPAGGTARDVWLRGDWARASALLVPYGSGMTRIAGGDQNV